MTVSVVVPTYTVSVVVPTYNRRTAVVQCVRSLLGSVGVDLREVIVVDDASADGTPEVLAAAYAGEPRVRVLTVPHGGAAAARNAGAAAATGDVVSFLDDDMIADPGMLAAQVRALADPTVAAVVGHMPLAPGNDGPLAQNYSRWVEARSARLAAAPDDLEVGDLLSGQFAVRREVFRAVGGFDEEFNRHGSYGGEDTDLLLRVAAQGRVVFARDAVSSQDYRVTPEQLVRQWRQAGSAQALLSRRHPGLGAVLAADHTDRRPLARAVKTAITRLPDPVWDPIERRVTQHCARPGAGEAWLNALVASRDRAYWTGVREAGGIAAVSGPVVLAYHDVVPTRGAQLDGYAVTRAMLDAHLRALADAGFEFGDPAELAEEHRAPQDAVERFTRPRKVYLTFDDAYAGIATEALPVLREHGARAACFVVTDRVGGENVWDGGGRALLDLDGLRALLAAGWLIGSHTMTHPHLTQLPRQRMDEELEGSLAWLRGIQPGAPALLAYPHGAVNAVVSSRARRAGYDAAFTIGPSAWSSRADRWARTRLEVSTDTTPEALVTALTAVDDAFERRRPLPGRLADRAMAEARATGRRALAVRARSRATSSRAVRER